MKFWKMSGAGNDFILITGGRLNTAALKRLAVRLCGRLAVGADGLLYVNRSGGGIDARYLNSDGSEAFCGNGSRCAAWWAWRSGLVKGRKFELKTMAGVLEAEIAGSERVRMRMPDVASVYRGLAGKFPAGIKTVHFLNTGVPHAVVPVSGLESFEVEKTGRAIRYHRAFGPGGTNVDFVSLRGGRVSVRTYERGVEGETLACGTGITAAAVALVLAGKVRPPVRLTARSGEEFTVWLKPSGAGASGIFIEGPARIVFTGEIKC